MSNNIEADVVAVSRINAVPSILEVICRATGMGFSAIARVTERRWVACAVRDEINFGLQPGEDLDLETTICNEIRASEQAVVIDHVAEDVTYCQHPTPALYGFQSYISVPLFYPDGRFFGTLCSIDPKPAKLNRPEIVQTYRLFADLIMFHLTSARSTFSLELADSLRSATSPEDIISTACEMLGRRLNVSRVVYGEVDDSCRCVFMRRDWTADRQASVAGFTKLMNDFGPELIAALKAGDVIVNEDVALHPYTASHADAYNDIGVRSELLVPLVKFGKLRLVLAFHRAHPHRWASEEIELALDMAERTWLAVDAARAQSELRTERDQSQHIFASMKEGFCAIDGNWLMLYMNPEGLRLSGRTDVIGTNHWETWPELVGTEVEHLYRRVMETRQAETREQQYTYADGRDSWIELRVYPALDKGISVFFRDVTSRKEAEIKLTDADRRKDEFLAMLAHELRNPLAPIGAAAKLLQIANLDEDRVRKTSKVIGRQVQHMTELIDDLLDVSRVTRGLIELDKVTLDFRHVINDAVEQVNPLIRARSHELTIRLAPQEAMVIGDKKRLVQVLANILNNAGKYTAEGGHLVLSTTVQNFEVVIEVTDDGIGMTPETAKHAFDLFAQAERTSDRSSGGLGLGLALVKSMVELHGGSVACKSSGLGKGSTFSICLPLLRDKPQPASSRSAEASSLHAAAISLKILTVDDNVDAAEMLALLLETMGHEVLIEHDAYRALERAKRDKPQVCLLDIGLPEIDGNELARRLRAQPETSSAILVAITGYGQESDRLNALSSGFDHHLVKPIDTAALTSILSAINVH